MAVVQKVKILNGSRNEELGLEKSFEMEEVANRTTDLTCSASSPPFSQKILESKFFFPVA